MTKKYEYMPNGGIKSDNGDGSFSFIPEDPGNKHYRELKKLEAEGLKIAPAENIEDV